MQPIDRDTQIQLMTNSEDRLTAIVDRYLIVPEIAAAAKRCAFDETRPEYTSKRVRVARTA